MSPLISQTTKYLALTGVFVASVVWFAVPYLNLVKPGLTISISVLRIRLTLPLLHDPLVGIDW